MKEERLSGVNERERERVGGRVSRVESRLGVRERELMVGG